MRKRKESKLSNTESLKAIKSMVFSLPLCKSVIKWLQNGLLSAMNGISKWWKGRRMYLKFDCFQPDSSGSLEVQHYFFVISRCASVTNIKSYGEFTLPVPLPLPDLGIPSLLGMNSESLKR